MEDYLNYLKDKYNETKATRHLRLSGWEDLSRRLSPAEVPQRNWFRSFALALVLLVVFLGGAFQLSQGALPGDFLYPVKILSERIIQKTSGDNEIIVDHRAQEIIGLSQRNQVNKESLERISIEYKEVVDQTKANLEKGSEMEASFVQKLKKHHSEFERIRQDNPEIEREIKDAEDASDHGN